METASAHRSVLAGLLCRVSAEIRIVQEPVGSHSHDTTVMEVIMAMRDRHRRLQVWLEAYRKMRTKCGRWRSARVAISMMRLVCFGTPIDWRS